MNVEQYQVTVDPYTKPTDLGRESACRPMSSTPTIAFLVYHSTKYSFYYCGVEISVLALAWNDCVNISRLDTILYSVGV